MNEFSDPTPIATPEQFKKALIQVRDKIGITQMNLAMLKAHCDAPAHTISTTQLAKAVGYPNFGAANMQYGIFAHLVADALHYVPKPYKGNYHWWRTLAYGNDDAPQLDDGCYGWVMRPELVQTLQAMRWV